MNNEYVYPAVFHHNSDDGSYTITFPDLPGCISEGKNLSNALYMASDALTQWVNCLIDEGEDLPAPSDLSSVSCEKDEFVNIVRADIKDNHAVRRTISIPKWMDDEVNKAGISLSKVLQDALKEKFSA